MRKVWLLTFLYLMFTSVTWVSASDVLQGDDCTINAETNIEGNLYVLCRLLTIEGRVDGNIIGAVVTASITGEVTQSVYLAAGRLDVSGTVGGDVHFIGGTASILNGAQFPNEHSDILAFSVSTLIDDATLNGTVTGAGYQLLLRGDVAGEVRYWGSALEIDGRVDGNVDASVGDPQSGGIPELRTLLTPFSIDLVVPGLRVFRDATIEGQLNYIGPTQALIETTLAEEPIYTPLFTPTSLLPIQTDDEQASIGLRGYLTQVIREFLTLFVVGSLILFIAPNLVRSPIPRLESHSLASIGLGTVTFVFSFPFFLILLILMTTLAVVIATLQVNELSLISFVVTVIGSISLWGIFYLVAFFVSRIIVSFLIGQWMIRRLLGSNLPVQDRRRIRVLMMFVGALTFALAVSLPIIGWMLNLLALFGGLGALTVITWREIEYQRTGRPVQMRRPNTVRRDPSLPRLPDDDSNAPSLITQRATLNRQRPGMENLPEGFQWWD